MRIINLLPLGKQKELRYRSVFETLVKLSVITAVSFVLVFLGQLGSRWYLDFQLSRINSQIEQLNAVSNKQENAVLKNRIKLINSQITDFNNIMSSTPAWSKVLSAFAVLVPEQVAIQGFTVDAVKKQVNIRGFSPSREQVIALYNNISGDKQNFSGIDYPLENVAKPSNVSFHFTFTVADSLLKK